MAGTAISSSAERWGHAHECTWNATFYTSRREERDRKISECERLYGADQ
jgi:hypothetical protein